MIRIDEGKFNLNEVAYHFLCWDFVIVEHRVDNLDHLFPQVSKSQQFLQHLGPNLIRSLCSQAERQFSEVRHEPAPHIANWGLPIATLALSPTIQKKLRARITQL